MTIKCSTAFKNVSKAEFDFTRFVYSRLLKKYELSRSVERREYFRVLGLLYSLKKSDSRQVLKDLVLRFGVKSEGNRIKFKED